MPVKRRRTNSLARRISTFQPEMRRTTTLPSTRRTTILIALLFWLSPTPVLFDKDHCPSGLSSHLEGQTSWLVNTAGLNCFCSTIGSLKRRNKTAVFGWRRRRRHGTVQDGGVSEDKEARDSGIGTEEEA